MTDTERARAIAKEIRVWLVKTGRYTASTIELDDVLAIEVEAALRAVQEETEQRMNVQRALAWDETAKRIEEIDTLTEERDALRIRCATIQEETREADAKIADGVEAHMKRYGFPSAQGAARDIAAAIRGPQ